jgi:hypothetical protein
MRCLHCGQGGLMARRCCCLSRSHCQSRRAVYCGSTSAYFYVLDIKFLHISMSDAMASLFGCQEQSSFHSILLRWFCRNGKINFFN